MTDRLNNNPLSELLTSLKSYLDLRLDEIKLSSAENLAKLVSKLLYILVMFFILALALGFLCVCFSRWISDLSGCGWAGPITTFGILMIMALVLHTTKDKILIDHNLRLFIEMFFGTDNDEEKSQPKK